MVRCYELRQAKETEAQWRNPIPNSDDGFVQEDEGKRQIHLL